VVFCSLERLDDKIKTFSTFGDTGKGGVTRFSLSPEALAARTEFKKRMEAISATVVTDDMALYRDQKSFPPSFRDRILIP